MFYETIVLGVIGVFGFFGLVVLVKHVLSAPDIRPIYASPKIRILPEGGGGSCSGDGACAWGQGSAGPQVETVEEVEGDGTYYPQVRMDKTTSDNWSYRGIEIDLPIHIPVRKDA